MKKPSDRLKNAGWVLLIVVLLAVVVCKRILLSHNGAGENGGTNTERMLPEVSGHRGANAIAPENTLASLDSCIKYGVDWMECDVCISSDSVFYILHDWSLDRTTDGEGLIAERPSSYIDSLDAGSWFGEAWRGERVPRFEEILRKAYSGNVGITIDYRSGDLGKLLALIRAEGMSERCCFTFSDEDTAVEFRRLAPEVKTLQAYVRDADDLDRVAAKLSPDIAVVWMDTLDESMVRRCRERGMKVLGLALGLDDKTELNEKAIALGVDVIATDRPEEFIKKYRNE